MPSASTTRPASDAPTDSFKVTCGSGASGATRNGSDGTPTNSSFEATSVHESRGARPFASNAPSAPLVATTPELSPEDWIPHCHTTLPTPPDPERTFAPSTGWPSGPTTRPEAGSPRRISRFLSATSPSFVRTTVRLVGAPRAPVEGSTITFPPPPAAASIAAE